MKLLKLLFSTKVNNVFIHGRLFATKSAIKTSEGKSREPKISNDHLQHFKTKKQLDLLRKFPEKLLRKKHKVPYNLYVADQSAAKIIANHVVKDLPKGMTIAEINPGPGLLTNELIKRDVPKLILFEAENTFIPNLEELHTVYPDKIKVKAGDFINLWKLHFRDKIDNGTRLNDLISDIPRKEFSEDVNMRLVAGVGYYDFFKHLINSLVFQTSLLSYGRCEMYMIVPPPLYIHLTCGSEIGYLLYRASSMLFQVMFEYKLLARIPREHFLPWQYEYNLSSQNKLSKVKSINPEFLYLVKMVPRRNLYELCPVEDMPAFWYFVKQNCVSRKNRVIPCLERWVPGCGPRLIINSHESKAVQQLYPDEDLNKLPPLSRPCTTMSNRDYYPNMNIFTEFGDLTPFQMLTLFCQFRSWPEYKDSLFLASLENSLLKMESANEEHVDGLNITEEDDGSIETSIDSSEDAEVESKGRRRG